MTRPVEGREAHRRVHRPTVPDGRERGARAEVTAHDAQPIGRAADHGRGAPRGVGMREAVEAVLAQGPALAPFGRDGIGRGGRGHVGVEGRVEAGHRRQVRANGLHGRERRQRLGLVERREVGERRQVRLHRVVDADRLPVAGPAMDDAMAHRCQLPEAVDGRRPRPPHRRRPGARAGRRVPTRASSASRTRSFRLLDPALTTRMRPGSPGPNWPGRSASAIRPATSSPGSPARPRRPGACRRGTRGAGPRATGGGAPPAPPRPGTRSMTSMTRWKRSRSLSMTMSKGVVVVPSSL